MGARELEVPLRYTGEQREAGHGHDHSPCPRSEKSKRKEDKRLGQNRNLRGSSSTSTHVDHHRSKHRATDTGEDPTRQDWLAGKRHEAHSK